MQTMVLAVCDAAASRDRPLSYLVGWLIPVLEASLVVCVLALVLMGTLLPNSANLAGMSPASIAIVVVWVAGVWVLKQGAEFAQVGDRHARQPARTTAPTTRSILRRASRYGRQHLPRGAHLFVACVVTLAGGVALQVSGSALASRAGINGVVFGATVMARPV